LIILIILNINIEKIANKPAPIKNKAVKIQG